VTGLDLFASATTDAALSERAAANFGVLKAWAEYGDRLGVVEVIAEIHAGRQWEALGYESFQGACRSIMGGVPLLERGERREVVADLTGRGMSTRAIGATLGVGQRTVVRDQQAGESNDSPEIRGNDGKTYTPTTPETQAQTEPRPADPFAGWSSAERDALADFQATGRSLVVNMAAGAVCGPRIWAWAEANGRAVRIDRRTPWGNPFEIPADGDRMAVIAAYRDHYLPNKRSLLRGIEQLRGKILGCWCAPLPCHGHALIAEAYA